MGEIAQTCKNIVRELPVPFRSESAQHGAFEVKRREVQRHPFAPYFERTNFLLTSGTRHQVDVPRNIGVHGFTGALVKQSVA